MMPENMRWTMRLRPGDDKFIKLAEKGIFILDDEINECSFHTAVLDLIYRGVVNVDDKSPIWVIINSPGGDVAHGLGVYDAIVMLRGKGFTVNTLGMGHVASMATVILQAGTKRFSLGHTQFLVHQVRRMIDIFETAEEVNSGEERIEESKRLNDIILSIIAERSGIELEELKKMTIKKDLWLDPNGAKGLGKNGLIDEVITDLPF